MCPSPSQLLLLNIHASNFSKMRSEVQGLSSHGFPFLGLAQELPQSVCSCINSLVENSQPVYQMISPAFLRIRIPARRVHPPSIQQVAPMPPRAQRPKPLWMFPPTLHHQEPRLARAPPQSPLPRAARESLQL